MTQLCIYAGKDGRVAIRANAIEAIVELPDGSQIVSDSDTYRVACGFDEALRTWGEALHAEATEEQSA